MRLLMQLQVQVITQQFGVLFGPSDGASHKRSSTLTQQISRGDEISCRETFSRDYVKYW